jgi:hypothetical protein
MPPHFSLSIQVLKFFKFLINFSTGNSMNKITTYTIIALIAFSAGVASATVIAKNDAVKQFLVIDAAQVDILGNAAK